MAISWIATGSKGTGTTSLSLGLPASISAGDLLLAFIVNKYPTATPVCTTSGWAQLAQATGGAGSAGIDQGDVYTTVFYKVAVGTEGGSNVSFTVTGGNSNTGGTVQYRNATGLWSIAYTTGADNTPGTAVSVTGTADPGVAGGDYLCVAMGYNTDGYSYPTPAVSQTGITFGTATERAEYGTSGGQDCEITWSDHVVSSGTSSAAPVYTTTAGGSSTYNPCGGAVFVRIREDAGAITGTLSITLDNVTISSTGKVAVSGALSKTLDDTVISSTGTVKIVGTLTKTLDDVSIVATGTVGLVTITGTLSKTLDDTTITATGKNYISGELSKTLDDAGLSATGAVKVSGALSKTLDETGISATGSVKITGMLSKTLDDTSISSTGKIAIAGTLSKTMDDTGITSTGTVAISGSLAKTLDDVGISSSGKIAIVGSLSKTLDDVTILATGGIGAIITGTLTKTLDDITLAADGKVYISGSLSSSLDDVVISAAGKALVNGTLAQTLDDTGIVAAGEVDISGMLAQVLDGVTLSGSGTVKITGQLAQTLDDVSIVATGTTSPVTEIYEVEAEITTARLYAGEIDTEWANQAGITMQAKKTSPIDTTIDHVSGIMILVKYVGRLLKG